MAVQLRIARLVICALIVLGAAPAQAQISAPPSQPETARARYFRDHPDALHFSARILAYPALRHAFPCERRTS